MSTFATVRLRRRRTKGNGSRAACLAMVFKLCERARGPQMADAEWRQAAARRHRRRAFHRWRTNQEERRLITTPSTRFDNSSRKVSEGHCLKAVAHTEPRTLRRPRGADATG
nr:hypothetical protein fc95 [uncultured bacterium]